MAANATIGRSKKSSTGLPDAATPVVGTSKKTGKKFAKKVPVATPVESTKVVAPVVGTSKKPSSKKAAIAQAQATLAPVANKPSSKKPSSKKAAIARVQATPIEAPAIEPERIAAPPKSKKASKKKAAKQAPGPAVEQADKKAPAAEKKSDKKSAKKASKKAGKKASVPSESLEVEAVESEPVENDTPISPVETLSEEEKAERARIKAERVAARRAKVEAERKGKTLTEPEPEPEPDIEIDIEPEPEPEPEPLTPADLALIDEIGETLRIFEDAQARARDLRRSLRGLQNGAAAPLVLELFDQDGDPFQLRTHMLVALERMPEDDYFAALLEAMPRLAEEAPEWAFAALMRLLNTRSHPDDSAFRFEAAAREASPEIREVVAELLLEGVEDLPEDQATMVVQTITFLTQRR